MNTLVLEADPQVVDVSFIDDKLSIALSDGGDSTSRSLSPMSVSRAGCDLGQPIVPVLEDWAKFQIDPKQ